MVSTEEIHTEITEKLFVTFFCNHILNTAEIIISNLTQ